MTIGEALIWLPPETIVIHGAQFGADLCVDSEATKLGLRVISIPANWAVHGNAAGPIRNEQMLRLLLRARKVGESILVLAFHEDPGLGIGTRDMVTRALRAKIPVVIFLREPFCS